MTKIIAELCQNHNGDRGLLKKMIAEATTAGADYVKGQVIYSEDITHRERFDDGFIENNGIVKAIKRPFGAEVERLSKLDLTEDDYKWFVDEVHKQGAKPMLTIFSRKRVDFVASLPWEERIVKVASYDCISHPFLRELCDAFDHLVISVGGATDEEIKACAEVIRKKGKKFTFLHCVTLYPNSLRVCNLARMEFLRQFTDSVGWSDHTLVERDGIKAVKIAISQGANMVERHFTILGHNETKDGPISVTPKLLKEMSDFAKLHLGEMQTKARLIKEKEEIIGSAKRELTHIEALTMDYFRGRFASHVGSSPVYNWEDSPVK